MTATTPFCGSTEPEQLVTVDVELLAVNAWESNIIVIFPLANFEPPGAVHKYDAQHRPRLRLPQGIMPWLSTPQSTAGFRFATTMTV